VRSRAPWPLALSARVYRLLLAAYPAGFRRAYGPQMTQVFRDCCRDAYRQGGILGLAGLWLRTLGDLGMTAAQEHLQKGDRMRLKRWFDVAVALPALLLLAPLLALIAAAIKLDSPGPALYKDRRIGQGGRPFAMYKFRTMTEDSGGSKQVTRVGRVLRATMLDELPQLFNILSGDMSLIGPRPAAPGEALLDDPAWRPVLAVRPGVSGLEQVIYGFAKPDPQRRLELNLRYLRERSLALDLKLLLRTLSALLGMK
jgi:lipopolysaccharide/colanic/teichoic acid biosynthesis glycosyltransferase